jgi:hypothetical protein
MAESPYGISAVLSVGEANAAVATWNSATAQNTVATLVSNDYSFNTLNVSLSQTTTITGGQITFQGSYDGVTFFNMQGFAPGNFAAVGPTYSLVANTYATFQFNLTGIPYFQILLSTVLTGSGAVTIGYAADSFVNTIAAAQAGTWSVGMLASGTPLTATLFGSPPTESLNVYVVNPLTVTLSVSTIGVTQSTIPWTVDGPDAPGAVSTSDPVQTGGLDSNGKVRTNQTDFQGNQQVGFGGESADSFGRGRVSTPVALLSVQFQYDTNPLLFHTSLSGTGSVTKTANESSITLSTGGTVNGASAINQSKDYIRYEPGKSQLVFLTGLLGAKVANVRSRLGYFDANDGLYFEMDGTAGASVNQRTSTSGSPVTTSITQANWNIDKMDGTGPSGVNINFADTQIFAIDLQWLGVGRVRFGFDVNGILIPCHQLLNANTTASPYMNTANLPVRAEITNTGTAAGTTTMKQVCVTVISEGGNDYPDSFQFSAANGVTGITAASGTRTPLLSIQMKTTFNSITNRTDVNLDDLEIFVSGSQPVYWELVYDGVLTGASFNSVSANSAVNFDVAATVCTGGTVVAAGYAGGGSGSAKSGVSANADNNFPFVLNIAGNAAEDTWTLCATGIGGTATAFGTLIWSENR